MKTTQTEFNRWLNSPRENENLEFKEAKNQYDTAKLFKYCVAIANEGGGKFILGVSNSPPRRVVGSSAFPNLEKIASQIFSKVGFRVDVEEIAHPDGRAVIFHIPSRPRGTAYHFKGSYLMRSTEDTVAMSEDRLRQIFDEGKPDWLDGVAVEGCDAVGVIGLLNTQTYFDLLKRPYPSHRDAVLERFKTEGLISKIGEKWNITNLGAVLFAKDLYNMPGLRRKCPRLIVYQGTDKLQTRLDRTLNEGYAVGYENWIRIIDGLIPANEVIRDALRVEVKMFPEMAIRELLPNSLIHQDFTETGVSVRVEIYADRMEISNPGQPPIPTERFIDEYKSRNERLADLMRRLGICEEKGSGIDRVVSQVEAHQLPAPDFRVGSVHTTVVLYGHKQFEDMDRNDRIRACYQHCCLKYVMNEKMTNKTLRERFDLPPKKSETVSRIIADTIGEEKIKLADPTVASTRYRSYIPFWA